MRWTGSIRIDNKEEEEGSEGMLGQGWDGWDQVLSIDLSKSILPLK